MLRAANGSEIEASIDNEVPETLGLPHISHNWKREELARGALFSVPPSRREGVTVIFVQIY